MSAPLDLTTCDNEPIHIPGAIQPHGMLLAFDVSNQKLTHASENVSEHLGYNCRELLGISFEEFITMVGADHLQIAPLDQISEGRPLYQSSWQPAGSKSSWDAITHRFDGRAFIELEPARAETALRVDDLYRNLQDALFNLEKSNTIEDLATTAAQNVRRINGFDRVMLYRFDNDWHGEVIAEDRRQDLEPFLGLHYPASDIPKQARELYTKNWLRFITNRDYAPCPIVASHEAASRPLDLSFAVLRSVSPIHLEYLRNMGVYASMSLSIVRNRQLWGLIACHHYSPRFVPYDLRKACELLAQFMSLQITQAEANEVKIEKLRLETCAAKLVANLEHEEDVANALIGSEPNLLDFVPAAGAAVIADANIIRLGQTPNEDEIRQLAAWLSQLGEEVYATDHLHEEFGTGILSSVAAGLLAVNLGHNRLHQIVWFRPEKVRTVNWAGDPRKLAADEGQPDRLSPRGSFALWCETVKGHCDPWTPVEIEAATELRQSIVRLMLKRAEILALAHDDLRLAGLEREKALETERLARLESERLNRIKDEFVATLSHELRTPLNAILGWTQLLQMSESDLTAELAEGLDVIERNAKSQAAMIEDLLEISRIVSGRLRLELQDVNIADIVEGAIESLSVTAAAKKIRLEKIIDPLTGVKATGDPNRLRQIAWNLLSNAIKFTPAYGKVQVVLVKVDSHVELTIADTGIGIKREFLPHIFERYRQADASISRQYGGLGLGLAIVRNLVELHGGHIIAESAGEGCGSTFTVSLPIRVISQPLQSISQDGQTNFLPSDTLMSLKGLRVLVVDDEADARAMVSRMMSLAECEVTCAEDTPAALNLGNQSEFDLLISDIGMAGQDGYALIRSWRQREQQSRGRRTPAIALTAYARADDRRRALMAGFNAHLAKPVDAAELITTAASLTDRIDQS